MEQVTGNGAPLETARGAVLAFSEEVLAARHEEGDAAEHHPEPRHVPEERRVPGRRSFSQCFRPMRDATLPGRPLQTCPETGVRFPAEHLAAGAAAEPSVLYQNHIQPIGER